MSRIASFAFACAALLAAITSSNTAAAAVRIFSYDAANDGARHVAGDLTFQFDQRLIFTTILNIRSTEGRASADLKPADEHALGPGGLNRLIGATAQERDLYEVKGDADGAALVHAFCPGSSRAWLAFGRLVEGRPLRVQVIGDAAGGSARLCHTLDFNFRGEWRLPSGPGVKSSDLKEPRFPY